MLLLCNSLSNSVQNYQKKLGKIDAAMVRTSVLTVLISRCGLLEVKTILPACKNTILSAFSWLHLILYLVIWFWTVSTFPLTDAASFLSVEVICINVSPKKMKSSLLVLLIVRHKCQFSDAWIFLSILLCSLFPLFSQALSLRLLL